MKGAIDAIMQKRMIVLFLLLFYKPVGESKTKKVVQLKLRGQFERRRWGEIREPVAVVNCLFIRLTGAKLELQTDCIFPLLHQGREAVSYTHLTLPTNREV